MALQNLNDLYKQSSAQILPSKRFRETFCRNHSYLSNLRLDFIIETFCVCVPIFPHGHVVRWNCKYTKAENTEIGTLYSGYYIIQ